MNIVSVICENSAVKVPFAEKVISLISVNSVITRGVDIKFTVLFKNKRVSLAYIIFFVYFK